MRHFSLCVHPQTSQTAASIGREEDIEAHWNRTPIVESARMQCSSKIQETRSNQGAALLECRGSSTTRSGRASQPLGVDLPTYVSGKDERVGCQVDGRPVSVRETPCSGRSQQQGRTMAW